MKMKKMKIQKNEEDPGCNQMESLDQEQDTTPLPHEKAPQHVNTHVLPTVMTNSSRP